MLLMQNIFPWPLNEPVLNVLGRIFGFYRSQSKEASAEFPARCACNVDVTNLEDQMTLFRLTLFPLCASNRRIVYERYHANPGSG